MHLDTLWASSRDAARVGAAQSRPALALASRTLSAVPGARVTLAPAGLGVNLNPSRPAPALASRTLSAVLGVAVARTGGGSPGYTPTSTAPLLKEPKPEELVLVPP